MIVQTHTMHEKYTAREYLLLNGVTLHMSDDFHALVNLHKSGLGIKGVVAYNAFNGNVCQMHVAGARSWLTRDFLRAIFDYPFNERGCEVVTIQVSEDNARCLRLVRHLGWTEFAVLRDGWLHGVNTVLLRMYKAECRWIAQPRQEELKWAA